MDSFGQDLKYAFRALVKDRGYAIAAVLTLTLVLAANVAVFSVVNSLLLRPLPYPESGDLVRLFNSYPNSGVERAMNGAPDFFDRRRAIDALDDVATYRSRGYAMGFDGIPRQIRAMQVSPSFFPLLRVQPRVGRSFTESEGEVGNDRRVILSSSLAQELYGADSESLGAEIALDGDPYRVVGVMPPGFSFLSPNVQLWTPQSFTEELKEEYHSNNWNMIGRLARGATIEQAQAQVDALNERNLERVPQFRELLIEAGFHTRVVHLQSDLVRHVAGTLYLLWAGVVFVLLMGCVNVANLSLVRASVRLRELSMRVVLGAGRIRVARQLVTEAVLLTSASAVLGLGLGWAFVRAFSAFGLERLPRGTEVGIDAWVVLLTMVVALAAGCILGLIPVLHLKRINTASVLREEGRSVTVGRTAKLARRALVAVQIATAFMLLIGAGLLFTSFREILSIDPGFEPEGVLTASVMLPKSSYPEEHDRRIFAQRALEAVRALPGVEIAALTDTIPLGGSYSDGVMLAEGHRPAPGEAMLSPNRVAAAPGYFETLEIRLRAGRFFDQRDTNESNRVLIIDRALAQRFWPDQSAVGKRMCMPQAGDDPLQTDENTRWFTIVGVIEHLSLRGLVEPNDRIGTCFFVFDQEPEREVAFIIKSADDPKLLIESLRSSLASIDPELPLSDIRPLTDRLSGSLLAQRGSMLLTSLFAGIALFLATVGLYGIVAYLVTQRNREIGIRISLGSTRSQVFQLVMKEAIGILVLGLAAGLPLMLLLRGALASQLYGISPLDPVVLTVVTVALSTVTLAACCMPAIRATHIHPAVALKQ